jgi:conjugal transfer pilus assembly protein TraW
MSKHLFFFSLLFIPMLTFAKDFGREGHVFQVAEENLKEHLQKKLQTLPEEEIKKKLAHAARNPRPLHLPEAHTKRNFTYDPTYLLPETIKGENGEIIARKGDKVNPLANEELNEGLLFFDGSNPKHVKWAESQTREFLWILVKGSPLNLEEEKERPVYFDQGGALSEKFGFKSIPCRITQQEDKLLIEEIPLKKALNH